MGVDLFEKGIWEVEEDFHLTATYRKWVLISPLTSLSCFELYLLIFTLILINSYQELRFNLRDGVKFTKSD